MKKPYQAPKIVELGSVQELTQSIPPNDNLPDKCGGSGDSTIPGLWDGGLVLDCPGTDAP
jgi:hypothetical protein